MSFRPVMNALPPFLTEVEPEWFCDHVLPPVKDKHLNKILSMLQNGFTVATKGRPKETFSPAIVRERWRWFSNNPDKMKVGQHKDDTYTYRYLDEIVDSIITAAESLFRKKRIPSTQRPEDLGGLWEVKDAEYVGPDRVALWQFARYDANYEIEMNRLALLGKAARSLRCDARRRFRIGVTIENTTMRFWLVSRVGCILSEPFDFIKIHWPLVCYAASTAFASDWELGYDPTARHRISNGRICLDFLISDEGKETWYRTAEGILYNPDEHLFLGSGVRVWMANKLDESEEPVGPEVVLKDYWILADARTEGEIQSDIFRRAKEARRARGEPEGNVEKYFMTILHDVPVAFHGQEDSTELFMRTLPEEDGPVARLRPDNEDPYRWHSHFSMPCQCNGCRGLTTDCYPRPHVEHRRHRRLVFEEVGSPLEHLSSLPSLLRCLADSVKGLKVLHDAQYVHRDISAANLLLCQTNEGPVCKISDLEFAQPQADRNCKKTGTPAFVACEVLDKYYNFYNYDYESTLEDLTAIGSADRYPRPPEFQHNYMHDLESLWWIAIYMLFRSIPVSRTSEVYSSLYTAQESAGNSLFLRNLRDFRWNRSRFFRRKEGIRTAMTVLPAEYAPTMTRMVHGAKDLCDFYISLEKAGTIDRINTPEPYTTIYDTMLKCFKDATRDCYREEIQPFSEVREMLQREQVEEEVEMEDYAVEAEPAAGPYNLRLRKTK